MAGYEKRDAKDRVFFVTPEEQQLLKSLPGPDMYSRLKILRDAIESLEPEDLTQAAERRPWKIRVPIEIYNTSKAKAEEMGTSILNVLLLAAEHQTKPGRRKVRGN